MFKLSSTSVALKMGLNKLFESVSLQIDFFVQVTLSQNLIELMKSWCHRDSKDTQFLSKFALFSIL